jgi:TolA-binding protein
MQPCPDSMFNPITFPEGLRKKLPQQAKIIETPDGGGIDVEFGDRTAARLVRLYIVGFKGMAPSIKALTLSDSTGKVHFPVKEDFMTLRDNQQLEVLPGDQVSVRYEDDVTATPNRNKLEQSLLVAFNTASITASFLNYETTAEGRKLVLEPIRRFRHGDAVAIVIDDADMDSKPEPDVIEFKVSASGGGEVVIKALETEKNSGRFIGRVFPVIGKPARESEIQIQPGGTITAVYRDQENLNPGIPADRTVTIEHAQYSEPKFGAYTVGSTKIAVAEGSGGKAVAKAAGSAGGKRNAPEVFAPRRTLNYTYVADPGASGQDMSAVIGASLRFDVVVPHLALAASSEIAAYVQTDKARKANATNSASASKVFDIGVPGTLKLMAKPRWVSASVPPAYTLGRSPVPPSAMAALDEGRFSFSVPLVLGDKPARSFATKDAESLPSSSIPAGVAVQDGDIVHAGFAYKDEAGNLQWKTASFTVGCHSFLDVMNETYNEPLTSAFVGEKVFVRVIAPGLDAGPERDMTSVSLSSGSNVTSSFSLRETEAHSGVFKGVFTLGYAEQVVPAQLPPVELNGFPVRYGDQLTVAYSAAGEDTAQTAAVTVNKGADGMVEPFTKRFAGGEMAAKTSFTLAECFFELAKKHSQMDQESLARREFEHAQKLLDEAIATHRDEELRAHAEYLSGNLAQEYADLAKNVESKTEKYQQALKRFMKIPVDYPKSEFAPKSQYKTALVYEKMKELEIAVEEYVKLAYKYPESEHIPEVMSRLGGYFQSKGQVFKEQADLLREKTDMESKAEVIKLDEKSYPEFLKAALIFGKLVERFPDHDLAGLAGLRSSQNYMRVHQYKKALEGFAKLVDNETYDANEIRSQALFWMGLSYERISDGINAYKTYRRVTYDFPDSKYAKMARGRLSDPAYAKIIEVEQRGRQGMINALKEERKKH